MGSYWKAQDHTYKIFEIVDKSLKSWVPGTPPLVALGLNDKNKFIQYICILNVMEAFWWILQHSNKNSIIQYAYMSHKYT